MTNFFYCRGHSRVLDCHSPWSEEPPSNRIRAVLSEVHLIDGLHSLFHLETPQLHTEVSITRRGPGPPLFLEQQNECVFNKRIIKVCGSFF